MGDELPTGFLGNSGWQRCCNAHCLTDQLPRRRSLGHRTPWGRSVSNRSRRREAPAAPQTLTAPAGPRPCHRVLPGQRTSRHPTSRGPLQRPLTGPHSGPQHARAPAQPGSHSPASVRRRALPRIPPGPRPHISLAREASRVCVRACVCVRVRARVRVCVSKPISPGSAGTPRLRDAG